MSNSADEMADDTNRGREENAETSPGFSNPEDDPDYIGIPHVPYMIWEGEKERAQKWLDEGRCPRCGTELIDDECPRCDADY
jgi:hypothetical protein